MGSRFVRASAYRHTYGAPAKPENRYDNIKISASAWDTNLVSASSKYLAVNWQASGGGAFLVTPLDVTGKASLPDLFPLCRGHTAPVLDTAWSPFDDSLVASVGEDSALALTRVDDQLLHDAWSHDRKEHLPDIEPLWRQSAHGRKAGHVKFHPTAEGILATASNDVKIWDVNAQKSVLQSETHADMVQSFDWDWTGSTYATTCKDKKLRLFDPRSGAKAVTVADSHTGVKSSRVCWLGSLDRIVTTGFSRTSDRQTFLWDSRDLTKGPIKQMTIDQSSGMLMPFFVAGNNVLFLAGKGDGNVRMYELADDELFYLSDYSSPHPQRGMCFAPARAVNPAHAEIGRAYKAVGSTIEPISFIVPRKSDAFQADLFPPAPSDQPALSSTEWLNGKTAPPVLIDMETRQISSSTSEQLKPYKASTPAPAPAPAEKAPVEKAPVEKAPEPTTTTTTPAPAVVEAKKVEAPAPEPKKQEEEERSVSPTPAPAVAAVSSSPSHTNGASSAPAPVQQKQQPKDDNDEELADLREENEHLRSELAEKDAHIRELELKLERIRTAMA
ncbi:Coronin-like protein crn1 [Rhodotorula mucilaginosa]|uniref:Coronin-like protein crn1 n=1 Tax=Rhodotorula mucilaginosa TaxID=5537 RepID=A0A9P6W7I3_RHOMI|nr:Coronin-like protein crn1 [Rhodotorula mucilaginosa]